MAVPLAIKDRVIGLLTMSRTEAGYFTEMHARIASAVGQQAAVAIENARLYQEAELRTREMAALLDVSKDIASTLDRGALVRGILAQLRSIVEYNGASIILKEGDELAILDFDRDADQTDIEVPSRFPLSAVGPLWSVMLRGEELITRDVRDSPRDEANFREATGDLMDSAFSYVRALLSVPLVVQDRVIGLVMMSHKQPGHFTRDHARLVRSPHSRSKTRGCSKRPASARGRRRRCSARTPSCTGR
jgi:GAF domain-containing protein